MSDLPALIEPELATLATRPPTHGEWSYEIKFDGYRMMARIENGDARLISRNGLDWSKKMPHIRAALASFPVDNAWLDGEAVALDAHGRPDFNALQNAFDRRSVAEITLFLFDLLWLDGIDRRHEPLSTRRQLLRELLDVVDSPLIRFSDTFDGDPDQLLLAAREMKLEGIIGKRTDSPYRSGRSMDWIKMKCEKREGFLIGGVAGGSFLLGVREEDGSLRYVSDVEAHLSPRQTVALQGRLKPIAESPFAKRPKRNAVWVQPEIIAQVRFLEWTPTGRIRHGVFEKIDTAHNL